MQNLFNLSLYVSTCLLSVYLYICLLSLCLYVYLLSVFLYICLQRCSIPVHLSQSKMCILPFTHFPIYF